MNISILGGGWLGKKLGDYLGVVPHTDYINSQAEADGVVYANGPDVVINCIGKTGTPNVDWCQDHRQETFFSNVMVPFYIYQACKKYNVKMVHVSSGCIYQYPCHVGFVDGFREEDTPNFSSSFYSWSKIAAEKILPDDVLKIRIRMPLDDTPNPRNLLNKLIGYKKILLVPNSITCVPDFLAATKFLIENNKTGIFNVVNGGVVTHGQILARYAFYAGIRLQYEVVDKLETKAERSNCRLSNKKLIEAGFAMPEVNVSVDKCVDEYVKKIGKY